MEQTTSFREQVNQAMAGREWGRLTLQAVDYLVRVIPQLPEPIRTTKRDGLLRAIAAEDQRGSESEIALQADILKMELKRSSK